MRREGKELWLTPEEWKLWVAKNHPERIWPPEERAAYIASKIIDPRVEAKQFRAGQAQGVLARTSPLQGELARKARF